MKLSVEITQEKFEYSYEVGGSKQTSSRHLCADSYVAFTRLLEVCSRHYDYQSKKSQEELVAMCWMEEHKEKAAEFLKTSKD